MSKETKHSLASGVQPIKENDPQTVGVAILGYAFMGKAHSNAYKTIPYMMFPPPAIPRLVGICGTNQKNVMAASQRYGFERAYTNWKEMLDNVGDRVQVFDNCASNDVHLEPSIKAAEHGMHVICEKPLGRNADEARILLNTVQKAGVKHMTAFNYRFVPAIRQIKLLIDRGKLGKIYHYRAAYLQEWAMPHYSLPMNWRFARETAGSGAIGDLGTHIIDLGRYLVGEMTSVSAFTRTFIDQRPTHGIYKMQKVDVDDAFVAAVEFDNGAVGTIEATRFAAGRKNYNCIEIYAEKGSVSFNLERMNELQVFWVEDNPKTTQGFHDVLVTEGEHPWIENWWPQGHIIGWEHTFIHELSHFLDCIVNNKEVAPIGATFEDGYRAAVISDAIMESAEKRRAIDLYY